MCARVIGIFLSVFILFCSDISRAHAVDAPVDISEQRLKYYLQYPRLATLAQYGMRDDIGNTMDSPSIVQLLGQAYKYAAVYHTAYPAGGGALRFKVNVAASNDLLHWRYLGLLADNASMPRIGMVRGTPWLVVAHEQWVGPGPGSTVPSRLGYRLYYSGADLVNRVTRSLWVQPSLFTAINGTPSFYDLRAEYCGVYRCVAGEIGLHYWSGQRDLNAVSTTMRMFDPRGGDAGFTAAVTDRYNLRFAALGVTGNLGQRDHFATSTARYLIQEGNVGRAAASWDKWRIYLYRYVEPTTAPSGIGVITPIAPQTPGGSTSFGNPSIRVVDDPAGSGKVVVISYFLFSEGAARGEAGSLLYYFRL